MERALPLVASFFSSCTGGHRPPSMPAADRPPPDTSGAEPLPPSPVHIGIASWDASAWRPTVSGHSAALDTPPQRHRLLDLSCEAARQCALVRADGAQVQVALLAAAPPLAQCPGMPGDPAPAPWPTTHLCQPPGLPPRAVQAGAYQDQNSTRHVQGAQDKH